MSNLIFSHQNKIESKICGKLGHFSVCSSNLWKTTIGLCNYEIHWQNLTGFYRIMEGSSSCREENSFVCRVYFNYFCVSPTEFQGDRFSLNCSKTLLSTFITRKFYSIICLTFFCCCPLQKFKKKLMQILALMILVVFLAYYYTLRSSHFANKVKLRSLHLLWIQWQNFWTNNSK